MSEVRGSLPASKAAAPVAWAVPLAYTRPG